MFEEFFGLAAKPFGKTPDPAFLYESRQHREAGSDRPTRGPEPAITVMAISIFNSRSFRGEYTTDAGPLPEGLLGRVEFAREAARTDDPRRVLVGLDSLEQPRWAEQWISELPVESGHEDGFGYSHNGEVLFGNIYLPESELVDLERATLKLYVHIEQLLQHLGYPYCLRMWNFLAGINAGEGDHERYRLFSAGRARALALKPDFEQRLPAATAIGMSGPGLVVYFLAGKQPGQPVENPRQVSAYRYPRQYGPQPPSFARAMLAPPALRLRASRCAIHSVAVQITMPPAPFRKGLTRRSRWSPRCTWTSRRWTGATGSCAASAAARSGTTASTPSRWRQRPSGVCADHAAKPIAREPEYLRNTVVNHTHY